MALMDHYVFIKACHVGLAMLSGAVFMGRGLGVLMGSSMPLNKPLRVTSMVIDSALLLAALLMLAALSLNPFAVGWLQVKIALVLVYIVLGVVTMRLARSTPVRAVAYGATLLCYVMIFSIARAHDPAGLFKGWW